MAVVFSLAQTIGCKVLELIEPAGIVLDVNADSALFAVIGDFGRDGVSEAAVARMINGWQPDFILTTGDNNYNLGEYSTLEQNISKYYGDYIYNFDAPEEYMCQGKAFEDKINRFFPSPGNHDGMTVSSLRPYLNFFTLPGDEEYYSFTWGSAIFFSLNSNPSANINAQKNWLEKELAETDGKFRIVYFHHPPYSSGRHGDTDYMQWDFHKWGVDIVLTGHDHIYSRMGKQGEEGLHYIINGLGGISRYVCNQRPHDKSISSIVCYDKSFGAMKCKVTQDRLEMAFYSTTHPQTPIDLIILEK